MPHPAPLKLPLVQEQASLALVPEPAKRTVGAQLADPVQLSPPRAGVLVPRVRHSLQDTTALPPVATLTTGMRTARAIPNESRRFTRCCDRAHTREPAVGPQVLANLPHRVPRPDRGVARTTPPTTT